MEVAWQAHFVKNMFIRPEKEELDDFIPDFVVLNASKTKNPDWQKQGLNSENFVFFNLTEWKRAPCSTEAKFNQGEHSASRVFPLTAHHRHVCASQIRKKCIAPKP